MVLKPFTQLAAILAAVFLALGLTAPSAIAAAYVPSTHATISESTTIGSGEVTVTLDNQGAVLNYHLEVNGAPYGAPFVITGPSSTRVAYSGLKAGNILSVAYDNYVFQSFTISGSPVPVLKEVVPEAPTASDHTVTIPSRAGVIYTNGNGVVLPAGTYGVFVKVGPFNPDANGNLTVLAKAADGYVLTGLAHYNWPFVFVRADPVPPPSDNKPVGEKPTPSANPAPEVPAPGVSTPLANPAPVKAPVTHPVPATTASVSALPHQAEQTTAAGPSNYIPTAETAAGDELWGWLVLVAGLVLIVVVTSYQLVTRRR
jgi:hypothetical protein